MPKMIYSSFFNSTLLKVFWFANPECLSTCLSACLPFSGRGGSYGQWLAAASCVGRVVVRRKRRKAVRSVTPTFFHLLNVTVTSNPVVHLFSVSLLATAQHCQRSPRLLYHIHDAVQELQDRCRGKKKQTS